jgi:hypothetical protein
MANTIIYQAIWENKLAQRLDKPQNWKEICDVVYTDTQTYNFPLIGTTGEPAVATLTNTAAGRSNVANLIPFISVTETNETLSIVTAEIDSVYLDYADQAQSNYAKMAEMGTLLGKKMNERAEAIALGAIATAKSTSVGGTDFGDTGGGALGLASTAFTVTAANVDDVIRGVIREIQTANGFNLYNERGGFIVWRPADWEFVTQFMQANGFNLADQALRNGAKIGTDYLGLTHYVSTSHTSGHIPAGVKGVQKLGILKSTFGKTYVNEMPTSSTASGSLSGTQIHTRMDYGTLVPTNLQPVLFDVNVN